MHAQALLQGLGVESHHQAAGALAEVGVGAESGLEAADILELVGGKREVIGFASRFKEKGQVRKATDKAEKPDEYPLGFGLTRMSTRTKDYAPIKRLLEAADRNKAAKAQS